MRTALILLALALTAAGCVAPSASSPAAATEAATAAALQTLRDMMVDVPCEAEVGAGTSANLLPLDPLSFEEGDVGEIDLRGDLALVSRHNLGGLYVVNISNPLAPILTGSIAIENTSALDVKWVPGEARAIIGANQKLLLIDLADPAAPALVGEVEVPTQAHMVTPWRFADGALYVYVASQTTNQPAFIYSLSGTTFERVGEFGSAPGTPLTSAPLGNHDITIYHDEILDADTLYMADGVLGWSAWSLADPAAPVRIGGSSGQEVGAGYVHTIRVGFHDGMRVVVTMMEVGQNTLKVYDATNLNAPLLLARWNADPARPTIPQHNIQLLGDWLFLAHYTEGAYVFDLSSVLDSPPLVGTLSLAPAAHYAVDQPADGGPLGFANVWDLSVSNGVIWVSDLSATFTPIAFGCLEVGDVGATATA